MSSARNLRNKFFIATIIVVTCISPLILSHSVISGYNIWLSIIPILVSVYWQADCGIYSTPLIMHSQFRSYYSPQIISSCFRLSLNFIFFEVGIINFFTVLCINALIVLYTSRSYKIAAATLYEEKKESGPQRKQMLDYLFPIMPSNIFNSLFGQLQIFIIAYFGKVKNIAEIGALGRLSQVFVLLSAFNLLIVEPLIAKSDYSSLFKKYIFLVAGAVIIGLLLTTVAILYPQVYLFVLGRKYEHLGIQIVWLIASASVNFVGTTIWTMSSARKWVFWWGTFFYIGSVTACQVFGILSLELSETTGVLQLSLLTSVAILIVQICIAIVGFRKERKLYNTASKKTFENEYILQNRV